MILTASSRKPLHTKFLIRSQKPLK